MAGSGCGGTFVNKVCPRHRASRLDIRCSELKQGKLTDELRMWQYSSAFHRVSDSLRQPGDKTRDPVLRGILHSVDWKGKRSVDGKGGLQSPKQATTICKGPNELHSICSQYWKKKPHQTLTGCLERGCGRHSPWPHPPPCLRPSLWIQIPEEASFAAWETPYPAAESITLVRRRKNEDTSSIKARRHSPNEVQPNKGLHA